MATRTRNTPSIDWDDPAARLELISRVGPAAYSAMLAKHQRASVGNGYPIRTVRSERFGLIYMVDGLDRGAATLEAAREMAAAAPRGRRT